MPGAVASDSRNSSAAAAAGGGAVAVVEVSEPPDIGHRLRLLVLPRWPVGRRCCSRGGNDSRERKCGALGGGLPRREYLLGEKMQTVAELITRFNGEHGHTRGNSVNQWEQLAVEMNEELRIETTDWNETCEHSTMSATLKNTQRRLEQETKTTCCAYCRVRQSENIAPPCN